MVQADPRTSRVDEEHARVPRRGAARFGVAAQLLPLRSDLVQSFGSPRRARQPLVEAHFFR